MWARPLLCPDRAFDDVGAIMGRVVLEKGVGANGAFRARRGDPGHVSMTIAQDPQDVFVYDEFIIRNFMSLSSRH
jgi:hypothetical protein